MATQASASKWRKTSRRRAETLGLFQITIAIRKPTSFQASAASQNLNSHHNAIAVQPELHFPGCSGLLFTRSSSPARLCLALCKATPLDACLLGNYHSQDTSRLLEH